jgi:hypothetical protein
MNPTTLPRRTALASLLSAPLARLGRGRHPEPSAPAAPSPVLVEVPGPGFWHVDSTTAAVEPVHRRDVPALQARPEPMPEAVCVDDTFTPLVARFWSGPPTYCRRCPVCHAAPLPAKPYPGEERWPDWPAGKLACLVQMPRAEATVTEATAATFSFLVDGADGHVYPPDEAAGLIESAGLYPGYDEPDGTYPPG